MRANGEKTPRDWLGLAVRARPLADCEILAAVIFARFQNTPLLKTRAPDAYSCGLDWTARMHAASVLLKLMTGAMSVLEGVAVNTERIHEMRFTIYRSGS